VIVQTPAGVDNIGERIAITAKATSIPASTLGSIPIRYFGREVKFAGTRVFQPWNITVLNDEDFAVRQALETWSNLINAHEANLRDPGLHKNNQYRTTATVTQFSKIGTAIRSYEFVNIFPVQIDPIQLSWDDGESIEQYGVTFDYDYWRIVAPGNTGTLNV
jgi:hypothetical protein